MTAKIMTEDDLKKVKTQVASTESLMLALAHSFTEGGWRHGVELLNYGALRERPDVQILRVRAGDRKIRITIAYE